MQIALLLLILLCGCCPTRQTIKVSATAPVMQTDKGVVTASYEVEIR